MAKQTAAPPSPEIHRATLAEIKRQVGALEAKKRVALDELIAIETSRAAGAPPEQIAPEAERDARAMASVFLNGNAPDYLKNGAIPRTRFQQLEVEIRGIDIALEILRSDELRARAAEVAAFAAAHRDEWCDLARRILLTAINLQRLEAQAAELRKGMRNIPLPLGEHIGGGRSILDATFAGSDVLSRPIAEAISLGLISKREAEVARRPRNV